MLSEIEIALQMLGDTELGSFLEGEKLKRAVGMMVINIGELIKNISDELRTQHPEIPWRAIAGMRDIAAHKYQTLRMEDVYNTVKIDIPRIRGQLNDILREAAE